MRKTLGIFIIVIGGFIFICEFLMLLGDIPKIIKKVNNNESLGFLFGYIISGALFFLLSVWMIRKGAKMQKPNERSVVEKIKEM